MIDGLTFSLLKQFSTGSLIIDTLFASILISILSIFSKNLDGEKLNSIYKKLINIMNNLYNKTTVSIQYESWIFVSAWNKRDILPEKLNGILYHINSLSYNEYNIHHLKHENCNDDCNSKKKNTKFDNYSLYDNTEYKIGRDLFYQSNHELFLSTEKDGKIYKRIHTIYCKKNTDINKIVKQVEKWLEEYRKYIKYDTDTKQYVFRFTEKDEDGKYNYDEYEFHTNRSFENIYHPEKEAIIKKIKNFINSKNDKNSKYIKNGDDYSLGILLYGEPGCGKTSMIKSIAKLTGRHIVELKLQNIKTFDEFSHIFLNPIINDRWISNDKKIILIEDIDCMTDIVKKRDTDKVTKTNKENDDKIINDILQKKGMEKTVINDLLLTNKNPIINQLPANKDPDLTLSDILNTIQGVIERDGGMLIISTNHPEKLDRALIRDGRIDIKIKFEKCNKECMKQMFIDNYDLKSDLIDFKSLPENKWQYAEIKVIMDKYENYMDPL